MDEETSQYDSRRESCLQVRHFIYACVQEVLIGVLLSDSLGNKEKEKRDPTEEGEDVKKQQVPRLYFTFKGALLSSIHPLISSLLFFPPRMPHLPASWLHLPGSGHVCWRQVGAVRPILQDVVCAVQFAFPCSEAECLPQVGRDPDSQSSHNLR